MGGLPFALLHFAKGGTFFSDPLIISHSGTGSIFYFFADQLGTTRTITTGNGPSQTPGQLCYDADFTPYGQEISYTARLQTTACPPNYRFTGYELDSETGLNYAFARYYSSRLARFMSTDPLGGSVGDLQSHNAYAYTANNPTNSIDPSGMVNIPGYGNGAGWGALLNISLGILASQPGFGSNWNEFDLMQIPVYGWGFMRQEWSSSTREPVPDTYEWGYGIVGYGSPIQTDDPSLPSWCPPGDACDKRSNPPKPPQGKPGCVDPFSNPAVDKAFAELPQTMVTDLVEGVAWAAGIGCVTGAFIGDKVADDAGAFAGCAAGAVAGIADGSQVIAAYGAFHGPSKILYLEGKSAVSNLFHGCYWQKKP
ncbi:MAG TPA: RHS repeat-associated core domain-containing protein [Candidatus Dormibacteraeota bacterium]|nr:RHS repeat-associated core domain-containing protein [Candidatus Dormibacteraeota bacterium]